MPPFPERESSILAKLKKKKPQAEHKDIEPKPLPAALNNSDGVGHIVSPQVVNNTKVLSGVLSCF